MLNMIKKQNNIIFSRFARLLPYLLVSFLFVSFFIADSYMARSISGEVPDPVPSNLFIAEGIIFIIINLAVLFLSRKYTKSVIATSVVMALMVAYELVISSIRFDW